MCAYVSVYVCCAELLSDAWLFATPCTVGCQAHLSMGFSRPEYWSGFPCLPPGGLPSPGMNSGPTLPVDSSPSEPPGSEYMCICISMFICLWLKQVLFLEFTMTTAVCVPPEVIDILTAYHIYLSNTCIIVKGRESGVLQSMRSQWVQQDFLTDQQQCPCMCECICICIYMFIYLWLKPTPVFLPGEVHGQRTLAGYSPWGHKEWDTTERLTLLLFIV